MELLLDCPDRLGDTVLLEPILRALLGLGHTARHQNRYTTVFDKQGWPCLKPEPGALRVDLGGPWPDANRVEQYRGTLADVGFPLDLPSGTPRLDNIEPELDPNDGPRVGLVFRAAEARKRWPYFSLLAQILGRRMEVHTFDAIAKLGYGIEHVGLSLPKLKAMLASMDVVVSNDTGPAHVSAALGVPTVVLSGPTKASAIYSCYGERAQVLCSPQGTLAHLSVRSVLRVVRRNLQSSHVDIPVPGEATVRVVVPAKPARAIGLMCLDGLGGTVTLLDQATKIHRRTGQKVELITRGYEPLLLGHPSVASVRNVAKGDLFESTEALSDAYRSMADIRIAAARWYGKPLGRAWHELDWYYDNFPRQMAALEGFGLHRVQLADRCLGLPWNTVECFTYADNADVDRLNPQESILIGAGIDPWHQGRPQTKQWDSWGGLLEEIPYRTIQVGTKYDHELDVDLDLRGKTSLAELCGLIRRAKGVITIEGGLMHLAYACQQFQTVVLRGPTKGKLFEYPHLRYVDSFACGPCWSKSDEWAWKCSESISGSCMESIPVERVLYRLEEAVS